MKAWFCDNLDWFCSVTQGSENYSHSAPEIHGSGLFPAFIIICIVLLIINDEIVRARKSKGKLR